MAADPENTREENPVRSALLAAAGRYQPRPLAEQVLRDLDTQPGGAPK